MNYIDKIKSINKFTEALFENKFVQLLIKPISYQTLIWRFFLIIVINITLLSLGEWLNKFIKSHIPSDEKTLLSLVDIFISTGSWIIVSISFIFSFLIVFLRVIEIKYERKLSTKQILTLNEFIDNYQYNKFATKLDIDLFGRKTEIDDIKVKLNENNLLLITGKPGIGKTKVVIESIKEYIENSSYVLVCLINRKADSFDDINSFFNGNKRYLVFIDDVNRIQNSLDYLIQLYPQKIADGTIKIIMTVRDYAKDKVLSLFEDRSFSYKELEIYNLEKEIINQIVKKNFNINNTSYLDRINYLSKGNPRLAVMIAEIARKEDNLNSINDISAIYDEYYKSLNTEVNLFENKELMKVLSIISFYRTVDKSNEIQVNQIEEIFEIKINHFWENVVELDKLELVDLYENEVVKISDQILSSYLFYKAIFIENIFDINLFITSFVLNQPRKLNDTLNPIINSFDFEFIVNKLKRTFNELKESYKNNFNKEYELIKFFWYIDRVGNLVYLKKMIDNLSKEDIQKINEEKYSEDKVLELIKVFSNDYEHYKEVIDLLFSYYEKNTNVKEKIIENFKTNYGFKRDTYQSDYSIQRYIVKTIKDKIKSDRKIYESLFLELSKYYLQNQFESTEADDNRSMTIFTFKLVETDFFKRLREDIWNVLFTLSEKKEILTSLLNYRYGWKFEISALESWDKELLEKYIIDNFVAKEYLECKVVNYLCDLWDKYSISYNSLLRDKFVHEYQEVEKVFYLDYGDFFDKKKNILSQECDNLIKIKIKDYIRDYQLDDFQKLFKILSELHVLNDNHREPYQLNRNIDRLLIILSENFQVQFYKIIKDICFNNYTFEINPNIIVEVLFKLENKEAVKKFINILEGDLKCKFAYTFYQHLNKGEITKEDIINLKYLYEKETNPQNIPYNNDFFKKYYKIDNDIVIDITKIFYKKSKENISFLFGLESLFFPDNDLDKDLIVYFKNDIELLKKLYIKLDEYSNHLDYDSQIMSLILDVDENFIIEYLDKSDSNKFEREYKKLWNRTDYLKLFESIVNWFLINNQKYLFHDKLKLFFNINDHRNEKGDLEEKQIEFLEKFIKDNYSNSEKIKFLFSEIISHLNEEHRIKFITLIIELNDNIELFKELSLEKYQSPFWGSRIPVYQKELIFFNSLMPLFNGIKYLEHKKYIQEVISWKKEEIKKEEKRDFIDDF